MSMGTQERIVDLVHGCYWEKNANCAYTTLYCLERLTGLAVHPQLYHAVRGCHGAGGTGGQCGLVEGALLFLGLYGETLGKSDEEVVALCARYATVFTRQFGSLDCRDLRPGGFRLDDPPHMCERFTVRAVTCIHDFVITLK
ncbi:C-GCAxxG-C-C family protein [Desulfovibrio sp. 1188_IL3213]|uniref:C-GCAxxG-C-C family protein n=1 Tax=Desulfovibrio sp. 1188_IL3213 TaxID=3084052 RepID=UPI002FDB4235